MRPQQQQQPVGGTKVSSSQQQQQQQKKETGSASVGPAGSINNSTINNNKQQVSLPSCSAVARGACGGGSGIGVGPGVYPLPCEFIPPIHQSRHGRSRPSTSGLAEDIDVNEYNHPLPQLYKGSMPLQMPMQMMMGMPPEVMDMHQSSLKPIHTKRGTIIPTLNPELQHQVQSQLQHQSSLDRNLIHGQLKEQQQIQESQGRCLQTPDYYEGNIPAHIKHQQLQSQIEQYHLNQIPYPLYNSIPMHQQLHEAFGTTLGGEYSLPRKHPSTEQYESYQSRPKLAHSPSSGTRPRSSTPSQSLGYSAYPDVQSQRACSLTPDKRYMQFPRNLQYNPMIFSNPQAMELVPPHAHQSTHKLQRGQFQQLQPTITATPRRGRPPSLSQLTAQQQQLGISPFTSLSLMPLTQPPPFTPQSPSPPPSPARQNTTAPSPKIPPSEGFPDIQSPNRSQPSPPSSTTATAGTPKMPSPPASPQHTNSYLFNSPQSPSFFNAIIRAVKAYARRADQLESIERSIVMKAILQVCGLQGPPSESISILDLVNAVFTKSRQKRGSVQPILAELFYAAFLQVKWANPKLFSNEFPAPAVDTEGDSTLWGCTARSSMMQLHMLQVWAKQLENLPATQKRSIWETCKLIPSFDRDANQFPSLEGTIAMWAINPLDHQESITTMFSALGYLSKYSMLQADFFSPTEGGIFGTNSHVNTTTS
ncbi:hypothetical protein Pelo_12459 [Pelomyxa schiedti]|nr:hypothetical protein Pelo_12459 [Pelomyxa schiedti]